MDEVNKVYIPEYHLVETCIPSNVSIEDCHEKGYIFVVIG